MKFIIYNFGDYDLNQGGQVIFILPGAKVQHLS